MPKSFNTPVGRASFPSLDVVNQFGAAYSISLLIPKDGKWFVKVNDVTVERTVADFVAEVGEAVKQEAIAKHGQAGLPEAMRHFSSLKDGDAPTAFPTYRPEYAGHWVLNVSRKAKYGKPTVCDRNKTPIDASEVYAGCNALVFIDVYGYTFGTKKSVSISFQHVMKTGENVRFASSGIEADQAFADVDLPPEGATPVPSGFAVPTAVPTAPPLQHFAQPVAPAPTPAPTPAAPFGTPAAPSGNPFSGV